ncbi:MAG: histidine triad nucleotide-binding protein [Candidatus Omnitrophota bacterium]|nr:histidine triad nucleotide-binding protein [Candidatus Omnitrophota bacterium]
MTSGACIFCRIIKKEVPARIVFEEDGIVAFEDMNPQAPVHIIIISEKHIEKISDLAGGDSDLAANLMLAAKKIAKKSGVEESGYRLVINCNRDAGQQVFHLHLHLLGGRKFTWPPG